jgi:hypothetical protein
MRHLYRFARRAAAAALGAWCWGACCGTALAQETQSTEGESATAYALPYGLVMAAIVLGLLVVLKSSSRHDREKPEQYKSKDLLSKED